MLYILYINVDSMKLELESYHHHFMFTYTKYTFDDAFNETIYKFLPTTFYELDRGITKNCVTYIICVISKLFIS